LRARAIKLHLVVSLHYRASVRIGFANLWADFVTIVGSRDTRIAGIEISSNRDGVGVGSRPGCSGTFVGRVVEVGRDVPVGILGEPSDFLYFLMGFRFLSRNSAFPTISKLSFQFTAGSG
jgi:hypothetical protein